jgi:hypothetical protein
MVGEERRVAAKLLRRDGAIHLCEADPKRCGEVHGAMGSVASTCPYAQSSRVESKSS